MAETKQKLQLKDIFNRNLVLILFIQLFSDISTNFISSFLNVGAKAAGIGVAALGTAASLYTLGALIMRMPAGSLADSEKKKVILISALTARTVMLLVVTSIGYQSDMSWMVTRALHGMAWGTLGVILPATAAMMMDKKAMGTTFAVITACSNFLKQFAKSWGITLYKSLGATPAALIGASFAVVACILILFLDFEAAGVKPAKKHENKGFFANLDLRFVPIAFTMSIAAFAWNINNTYSAVVADERGVDFAAILTITAAISSVSGFVASSLCDIINARYVLYAVYALLGVGSFIVSGAETQTAFTIGMILITLGITYTKVSQIFLFKNCAKNEKGSVQATSYFMTDIISVVCGVVLGQLVANFGYVMAYRISALFPILSIVIIALFNKKIMNFGNDEE